MRVEATITELAPGGEGVAMVEIGGERRAVFARATAPGDRVVVEVDASKRPARGRVLELLTSGPDRAAPPCSHVDRCGGCDWMHLAPDAQRRAHEAVVRGALPKDEAWQAHPIVAHKAGATLAYRTRARVHARASGGRAIVGMHEAQSHEPAEVDRCVVLVPELDRARGRVAALLEGAHGRGDAQIALGPIEEPRRAVLELRWSGSLPGEVYARLERGVAAGAWAGARVLAGEATKAAIVGDPTPWMRGADDAPLRLAPGGFAQASEAENARLARRVAEIAGEMRAKKCLELFAGAGNLTVLLAVAHDVTSVESDRAACESARTNLAARGLKARVGDGDAEAHTMGPAFDLVVLDPPRTGARKAAAAIASRAPKHVIYVSCDPQTLGRDLALLAPRYAPRALETFEMFPGTSHVETLVALDRRRP
jgi:23S rRNA (uracil1939-C5)-methyltransferase